MRSSILLMFLELDRGAVIMRNIDERILQGCWSSWVYSDESVKLPERFLETAGSFTQPYFSMPIVASRPSLATRHC